MLEILQFGLDRNRGGIETYLEKVWRYIDHTRFHFNFIDMTGEGNRPYFYDVLSSTGCNFYKITPRRVSFKKNHDDISNLFFKHHFDILHFNVNTLSYILPIREAIKNNCKVLVHSRSSNAPNTRPLTWVLHYINKFYLQRMPITRIAVSDMAGKWLFGESDYRVINNGVVTEDFIYKNENRQKIRNELNCENKTVIGHIGAFVPAKNHSFIVNVFEEYLKINPNSSLWLIGDGKQRKEIELIVKSKGLENQVLFLGLRNDVQDLYAGMDLFLFPSLYEGFGNVVLEAQCEGLPCLLSDCIPQDTMIADNTFSYSLKRSLKDWAKKIQETVQAQKDDRSICYKEMEKKGCSVHTEIKRLENLYESMIQ